MNFNKDNETAEIICLDFFNRSFGPDAIQPSVHRVALWSIAGVDGEDEMRLQFYYIFAVKLFDPFISMIQHCVCVCLSI